jgi:SAM-dependent methyltransferase
MTDWKTFFQHYRLVEIRGDADLLYQVGASAAGRPISQAQFETIVESIRNELQLESSHVLLDLCCGNGVLTFELAKAVAHVGAVDISEPYLENARRFKQAPNVEYHRGDVAEASSWRGAVEGRLVDGLVDRIVVYDALAYFTPGQLEVLLEAVKEIAKPDLRLYVGNILDEAKRWTFFDTARRRLSYLVNTCLLGRDPGLGRWWARDEVTSLARKHGFACRLVEQSRSLPTARYRFDAVLTRGEG